MAAVVVVAMSSISRRHVRSARLLVRNSSNNRSHLTRRSIIHRRHSSMHIRG